MGEGAESGRVGGAVPVPPLSIPNATTPILLEVSSFMDGKRCGRTLGWALEKATAPQRLQFRVLEAHGDTDDDCISVFKNDYLPGLCQPGGNLRLRDPSASTDEECKQKILERSHAWVMKGEAGQGPAHQRGVASELLEYSDEDSMCLSTDSHMGFQDSWDAKLLDDWTNTRNEFAVLSVYPVNIGTPYETMVDLCGYSLEDGVPRGTTGGNRDPARFPYLTMNWAAGFSFARCHMERNVPVDRHLRWVFTGEEVDRAVRLFTNGYDMYLPTGAAVTHEYAHAKQMFWNFEDKNSEKERQDSHRRMVTLLKLDGDGLDEKDSDFGKFGLGTQRSLEDYVRWSKIDLGSKWHGFLQDGPVTPDHHFCDKLKRQPVKDESILVASASPAHVAAGSRVHVNGAGEIEIEGEDENTRPRPVL